MRCYSSTAAVAVVVAQKKVKCKENEEEKVG